MAQVKKHPKRQATRRAVLLILLLLFPVILNYFSPYVIIDGAAQGIINGSFITFSLMALSALFLGRLWCAWACPGGGLQEACLAVNDKPARSGRLNWIKWLIWVPWIGIIAALAISAGGYHKVDPFHLTDYGISVTRPEAYITYYTVVAVFLILSLTAGRRAGCHYICWMAPFMIIGRKVRNLFQWPALRLKANPEKCTNCKKCTTHCPMSLDVNRMVQEKALENSECILCGSCVDICPQNVIRYSFSAGKASD